MRPNRWILLVLIILTALRANAKESPRTAVIVDQAIGLFLDYAQFRQGTGERYLEVYYQVPHNQFQFREKAGRYQAKFDVAVAVYDADQYQLIGDVWQQQFSVDTIEETRLLSRYYLGQVSLTIPPQATAFMFTLEDHQSNRKVSVTQPLSPLDTSEIEISDILFASMIEPVNEGSTEFIRGDLRVTPNPTRAYGEFYSDLFFYYELYTPQDLTNYQTLCQIYNDHGDTTLQKVIPIDAHSTGQYGKLDLLQHPQGEYILEVMVLNPNGTISAQKRAKFSIRRSLFTQDYEVTLAQLSYIATMEEYNWLKSLPPEQRVRGLLEFWKRRDPTPNTPTNEALSLFYQRVKYANEQFSFATREGWETDRGRIFIKYGPPDQIIDRPIELDRRPYIIWSYDHVEGRPGGRQFLFVDDTGHGFYKLYNLSEEDR